MNSLCGARARTMLFGVVALLCLIVLGQAKNLHPACGGSEYSTTVASSDSGVLFKFPIEMSELSLDCFAYDVKSVKGGQSNNIDHCAVAHQTEYAYRLVLRAVYANKDGKKVTRDYDIRSISSGSITSLNVYLPARSVLSIVLLNDASDAQCILGARALLSWTHLSEPTVSMSWAPVLVGVDPPTIYAGQQLRSHFVLRHPQGTSEKEWCDDMVYLVNAFESCASKSRKMMDLNTEIPSSIALSDRDSMEYSAHTYTFSSQDPNTYRLCYRSLSHSMLVEIATINVYGGNPSYYDIVQGASEDGRVFLFTETTIKFFGHHLDTRPHGDRAKFVIESDDCATGRPAGGVPLETDLGPADDYGPNTTYTLWTWTMKVGGVYKVCYKRAVSNVWSEVPNINVVRPGTGGGTSPSDDYPVPTDPNTKESCPMAPKDNPDQPWIAYQSIMLVLKDKKLPSNLFATLSRMFCVPRNALTLSHVSTDSKGSKVVYFSLLCKEISEGAATPVCDSTERYNYIVSLGRKNDPKLRENGIERVEGSTNVFAFGDDPVAGGSLAGSLILAFGLVSCGALIAHAAMRYKERREYFVQFGVDDGDIDDMYAYSTNPAPLGGQNSSGPAAVPIPNAVIEIEE